jgi:hypothetical protein
VRGGERRCEEVRGGARRCEEEAADCVCGTRLVYHKLAASTARPTSEGSSRALTRCCIKAKSAHGAGSITGAAQHRLMRHWVGLERPRGYTIRCARRGRR